MNVMKKIENTTIKSDKPGLNDSETNKEFLINQARNHFDIHNQKDNPRYNSEKGKIQNGIINTPNYYHNTQRNRELDSNSLNCVTLINSRDTEIQINNESQDELKQKLKYNSFLTIDERKESRKRKVPSNINNYENNIMNLPDFYRIQHPDHPNDKSQCMFIKNYETTPDIINKFQAKFPKSCNFHKSEKGNAKILHEPDTNIVDKELNSKFNLKGITPIDNKCYKELKQSKENILEVNSLPDSQPVLIKNMHIYSNIPDLIYNNHCGSEHYRKENSLMDNIEIIKKKNQELFDMIPLNKDPSSFYIPHKIDIKYKKKEDMKHCLKPGKVENLFNINRKAINNEDKNHIGKNDKKNISEKSNVINNKDCVINSQIKYSENQEENEKARKNLIYQNQIYERVKLSNQNLPNAKNSKPERISIDLNYTPTTNLKNQIKRGNCSGAENSTLNKEFQEALKKENQNSTQIDSKRNRLTKFRERRNESQIEANTNKNMRTEFNNSEEDKIKGMISDKNANIITPSFSNQDNSDLSTDAFHHLRLSDSFAQSLRKNIEANSRRLSEVFDINQKFSSDNTTEICNSRNEKQKFLIIEKIDKNTNRTSHKETDKESESSFRSSFSIEKEKLNRSIKTLNKLKEELEIKKTKLNARKRCK